MSFAAEGMSASWEASREVHRRCVLLKLGQSSVEYLSEDHTEVEVLYLTNAKSFLKVGWKKAAFKLADPILKVSLEDLTRLVTEIEPLTHEDHLRMVFPEGLSF